MNRSLRNILISVSFMLASSGGLFLFVTSFIYTHGQGVGDVAKFYFVLYLSMSGATLLAGKPCKRAANVLAMQFGLFLNAVFFLALVFFANDISRYVLLLGALQGLVCGIFWLAFNVLVSRYSAVGSRQHFFSNFYVVGKIMGIVVPLISGWLIWYSGSYEWLFYALALCSLVGVFFAGSIEELEPSGSSYQPVHCFRLMNEAPQVSSLMKAMFMFGVNFSGGFVVLIPFMLYKIRESEMELGLLGSALPLIELSVSYLVRRISPRYHAFAMSSTCILLLLGSLVVVYQLDLYTVLLLATVYAVCAPINGVIFNAYCFDGLESAETLSGFRTEFFSVRELLLNKGRMLVYAVMIAITMLNYSGTLALQIAIFAMAISTLPLAWFVFQIPRSLYKESDANPITS